MQDGIRGLFLGDTVSGMTREKVGRNGTVARESVLRREGVRLLLRKIAVRFMRILR